MPSPRTPELAGSAGGSLQRAAAVFPTFGVKAKASGVAPPPPPWPRPWPRPSRDRRGRAPAAEHAGEQRPLPARELPRVGGGRGAGGAPAGAPGPGRNREEEEPPPPRRAGSPPTSPGGSPPRGPPHAGRGGPGRGRGGRAAVAPLIVNKLSERWNRADALGPRCRAAPVSGAAQPFTPRGARTWFSSCLGGRDRVQSSFF